ncbi:glycoside hydrolase N-terminal domain-containing protein [Nonomuraea sp. NPDC052265]|uniref:glycoside hydrolase N-terminal domain-containing protein n=1 Tax=Nonomuraea sp. NPDC052265 TaxID=3364374 RepID=UPI0037C63971
MLTLRYDEPAPDWEGHVLPIGNGALGACVFGNLGTERVQLNEKSLWTGGPGSAEPGYRRTLDLETAVAAVTYEDADGMPLTREYFASHPAGVIVGRLTAGPSGRVGFTLRFGTAHPGGEDVTAEAGRLRVRGVLTDNGLVCEGQVQVLTEGGTRTDEGDRVVVTGAESAVFVF